MQTKKVFAMNMIQKRMPFVFFKLEDKNKWKATTNAKTWH